MSTKALIYWWWIGLAVLSVVIGVLSITVVPGLILAVWTPLWAINRLSVRPLNKFKDEQDSKNFDNELRELIDSEKGR